ncbi:hypothetical protein F2Q68_00032722 [Brassica cretica]|uniref:Uncharacterized protein n=1 Tax=Brassica cretica TaxID=69181 RepID=A0A8S9GK20_BRACR|nr:hypothetical protein F2Q68_00032722 [Brassica cretica]
MNKIAKVFKNAKLKKFKETGEQEHYSDLWLTRMSRELCKDWFYMKSCGTAWCSLSLSLSLAELCRDCGGLDDLKAREPHSVARSHLSVHLLHCIVRLCLDWWSDLPENKRELDLGVMELLGALSLAELLQGLWRS